MCVVRLPHAADTDGKPKVLHRYRRNAPKKAPCPHCGKRGRRKDFHYRTVRSLAYQAILLLHLTTAEYRATCNCCTTFRTQVEGVEAKAHYDNKVREAVLDRLLEDRMTVQQIQNALQRDFFLDLSSGFLYDCLDWKIRQLDGAAYFYCRGLSGWGTGHGARGTGHGARVQDAVRGTGHGAQGTEHAACDPRRVLRAPSAA
jgi:hypothetical protein